MNPKNFSARAPLLILLGLGYVFLFGPMCIYFLVNESLKGDLAGGEVLAALGITFVGDIAFALICWAALLPVLRARKRAGG